MARALRFESVRVYRMPGFRATGFGLCDLSPGINVIHGPNGSGKTTSAHAIEALLWPRSAIGMRPHVSGRFRLGADEWTVELDYDRAAHQRNGVAADPPPIPAAEERDRYRLSLHELIRADNARFAEAILKEAAGGYDLAAAGDSLPSPSPLSARSRELREVRESMAELEDAVARQRELREDERRLDDLLRRRDEALRAAREADVLRLAIGHAEARDAEARSRAVLDSFPTAMEAVRGDERERLTGMESDLEATERAISSAEEEIASARAAVAASRLEGSPVDPALVAALRSDLETLRQLERKLEDCQRDREAAARRVDDARRLIGAEVDEARVAEIDIEALGDLTDLATRAALARQHVTAVRDRMEVLGRDAHAGDTPPPGVDRIARAEACLNGWLRAPSVAGAPDRVTRTAALAAGLALVMVGAALASAHALWLLLAALGAGVLAAVLAPRGTPDDPRGHHRREYAKLKLDPPDDWTEAAVERRLEELQHLKSIARLAEERESARRALEVELARAETDLGEVSAEQGAAAARLGVPADTDPAALVWLAHRVAQWQTGRSDLAGAEGAAAKAAAHVESSRAMLRARLAPFVDGEQPDTTGDFAGAIQRLDERREQRDAGLRSAAAAESMLRELAARRERCRASLRALYEGCGVPPGDTAALEDLCDSFSGYHRARKDLDEASFALDHASRALAAAAPDPELLEATPTDLRDRLRAADEGAARLQELSDQITRIRDRVDNAKALRAIETCNDRVQRSREALAEARERETRGVIGAILLDRVRDATETDHLPAVFHRARRIFTRITRGRYSLAFASQPVPGFHAFDNQERRGRTLEELSSGTRVQLLLAIRVAFVETQEGPARLPLVLDEVLGNSDDERASAIMDAVIELARDGRQIFYLTAQQDEVAKWSAALDHRSDVQWRLVDLLAARSLERPVQTPRLRRALAPTPSIPQPGGASHADYAVALGVSAIDPATAHSGSLHLWYLVGAPDRLHDLLVTGVSHWGELEALVRYAAGAVADETELAAMSALASAAEAWIECRRVGAGRRVDREALAMSGAVSDVFLDRATDLAERVGGDARRLISAVEAGELKRFRSADRLRDYLQEEGYLDPRDPLPGSEIRARVIGAVAREIERGAVTLHDVDGLIARLEAGTLSPLTAGPAPDPDPQP